MQKLSRYDHGVNFILVEVNTLSHFLWALPLREKTGADCENGLRKIPEALCSRNSSQTAMMKPKFCQTKWSNQLRAEKIWVDKGHEFACEFSEFRQENNINVRSTQ